MHENNKMAKEHSCIDQGDLCKLITPTVGTALEGTDGAYKSSGAKQALYKGPGLCDWRACGS